MKRKNFLANTSLVTLSFTALSLESCNHSESKQKMEKQNNDDDFELNEVTIDALQQKMKDGKLTSRSITELYLKRIDDIDKNGPTLKAVIELNPDALKEAEQLDEEIKNGKLRGALHGIPVLVKDNIDTANLNTTAGSLALENHKPKTDAFIVKQLREAGAVILGKTNLSEWANIRGDHSSSGWSSCGGQTKNPYIIDHNPVGSSSGSAVGVSANLCVVAVGTETDGSIVAPASGNGVVGIKPTVGLVSRTGIIPISKTQDTAGPIARTVRDAAILLGAMSGVDADDAVTNNSNGKSFTDYTVFLKTDSLKGKRIGVEKNWKSVNTQVNTLYKNALDKMKEAGAILVEIELMKEFDKCGEAEFDVLKFEFKDGLNRYLANADASVKSLADVIAFNLKNEARVMPYFKQEIFEAADATTGLQSKIYVDALATCKKAVEFMNGIFVKNKLDAIAGITMGPVCVTDFIYGDRFGDAGFAGPPAVAGYPHITVPCGMAYNQLPVGISFFGTAYTEPLLLGMAYAFEQITKSRTKPKFSKNFVG